MDLRANLLSDSRHAPAADVLAGRCPHVTVDGRVSTLGYRYYPVGEAGIMPLLVKRISAGAGFASIALGAGVFPSGDEPVDPASLDGSVWVVRTTVGVRLVSLAGIAALDEEVRSRLVAELTALGLHWSDTCPLCSV